MTKNKLSKKIINAMKTIALESGTQLVTPFDNETELLKSGLDSMGFAVLVAQLEEELGYDPFVLMEDPYYPTKYGELLDIYFKYFPEN
jgi:acyl carrier protein